MLMPESDSPDMLPADAANEASHGAVASVPSSSSVEDKESLSSALAFPLPDDEGGALYRSESTSRNTLGYDGDDGNGNEKDDTAWAAPAPPPVGVRQLLLARHADRIRTTSTVMLIQ
jgi:hypothetical protein